MSTDRRTLRFAGRQWWVKRSNQPEGPGPNWFDDSTDAVEVDADGSLSLRIRRAGGRWMCAELVGEDATGYGTYEWTVRTDLRDLERHVVCGMFTWSDDEAHHNREIDIEVSAWSRDHGVFGLFVVHPSGDPGHHRRFRAPSAPWRCSFEWTPSNVTFRAADEPSWTFVGGVPPEGPVHPRINLWLHEGVALPANTDTTVRFDDFCFTPGVGDSSRVR